MELNEDNREKYTRITDEGELIIDEEITKIDWLTFSGSFDRTAVKKVKIPNGVTNIHTWLFRDFGNLEEVILPEGLETIDNAAFVGCKKLELINIPFNVKRIGDYAFCDCEQIENIELPENMQEISRGLFENCSNLKKVNIPTNIEVIREDAFNGCKEEIIRSIPDRLKKYARVTDEGELIIGDEITQIDMMTFKSFDRTAVKKVKIPNGVTEIPSELFKGFENLEEVILPEGLETIGREAFEGCKKLKFINIPSNVKRIDELAFCNCKQIENIELPENMQEISRRLFINCSNLKKVNIPTNIEVIREGAFQNCSQLEKINFPENLKRVENAFRWCKEEIIRSIPDTLKKYTRMTDEGELIIDDEITKINRDTFSGFNITTVKKVKIPNGVTEIPSEIFKGFENLEEVILPEGLETIGKGAFKGCKKLKFINIPSNVRRIEQFAFNNCEQIENIELPENMQEISRGLFENCSNLKKVNIPTNIKVIREDAFKDCSQLEKINFPEGLEREEDAFVGCKEEIIRSIPGRLKYDENGVMTRFYSEYIVNGKLIFPNGVKTIKSLEGRFDYRNEREWEYSINEISFPEGLLSISDDVFKRLYSLKKVIMPDSVIELGKRNFYDCRNLEEIRLSRKLKTVTTYFIDALRKSNVRCVIIPDSVKEIDGDSSVLKSTIERYIQTNSDKITYYSKEHIRIACFSFGLGTAEQISVTEDEIQKNYSKKGEKPIIETEKNEDLKKQITMSDIKDLDKITRLVISSDNIKKIGPFALAQCPNLEEVIIEEGITEIGPGAFAECKNLKKVHFPKSLKKVSDYAFFCCDKLEEVHIDSKKVSIGDFSFSQCSSLQSVDLPERVDIIGKNAFSECRELKFISGMKDVDKIDDWAFSDCEQLKISIPNRIREIGYCAYCNAGSKNWTFKDIDNSELIEYPFNETIIIIPSTLEKMGDMAFSGCTGITQLHFNYGSKLKEIPFCAFNDCHLMSFVEFPEGISKIGDGAFRNCNLLEEIYFPETISEIGTESFANCSSLKMAMFKGDKKGEEISTSDSFYNCPNIKMVNFSELQISTRNVDGEIYEVARKEKEKNKFSLSGIKKAIEERKKGVKERK